MAEDLHPAEIRVLTAIAKLKTAEFQSLVKEAALEPITVTRTAYWLSTKGLVNAEETSAEFLRLTEEGKEVATNGLPERVLLRRLLDGNQALSNLGASDRNLTISIGHLKKKGLIEVIKGPEPIFSITEDGKKYLESKSPEEEALNQLLKQELPISSVQVAQELLRRNLCEKVVKKERRYAITPEGANLVAAGLKEKVGDLTPGLIKSGDWRTTEFRKYDVGAAVPTIYHGRNHPLRTIIQRVRQIFLQMGFTEWKGPFVESSFWCFDALFQPQDHPARELADTFYLKEPKQARLPEEPLVSHVKNSHERGVCGSTGWQYKWSTEIAKKLVMRTHTTAVSARALNQIEPPARVFTVDRVFRNETLDSTHLMELHQVEGIVYDENVTFRDLLGYLKEFYSSMGFTKLRFRPAYFPYTEMSVEPEVYFPEKKKWVELGGAGIFRPEVVEPLTGVDYPVLAWGLGLERLVMLVLNLQDIRDPYTNDLGWLRSVGGRVL